MEEVDRIVKNVHYDVYYDDEHYIRFSDNIWFKFCYESLEPVFFYEKLENEFKIKKRIEEAKNERY